MSAQVHYYLKFMQLSKENFNSYYFTFTKLNLVFYSVTKAEQKANHSAVSVVVKLN